LSKKSFGIDNYARLKNLNPNNDNVIKGIFNEKRTAKIFRKGIKSSCKFN